MTANGSCDKCQRPSPMLRAVKGEAREYRICPPCYLDLLAWQDRAVPDGLERHFIFYWWLVWTGRLNDWDAPHDGKD